jgi:hypothetical protein
LTIASLTTEIFEGAGNAQEKLFRLYGKNLNYSNAKKYLAGIKLHLTTLQHAEDNKQEYLQHEVSYNADKSQSIQKRKP